MKRIVTLTALAVSLALSPAVFAHGVKVKSGGNGDAFGHAWGLNPGGMANVTVSTKNSSNPWGSRSSTKVSSTSVGWADFGSVSVGASAGAGGSASSHY